MAATRNFPTVSYLQPMFKAQPASTLRRISFLWNSDVKVIVLSVFVLLAVYLLVSDLCLHEIRTLNPFCAGELWLSLWRLLAQAFQAVVHSYSALFLHPGFFTQTLFSFIGG
ncbi:MAG: hypothetical protein U0350_42105 [Caldilineaceae bacterium]